MTENPYQPTRNAIAGRTAKAPFGERLAVGSIFALSAIPLALFVFMVLIESVEIDEHTYFRVAGPEGDGLLLALLMSVVLFAAGFLLLLRRRAAIWLFTFFLAGFTIGSLIMSGRVDRLIWISIVAVSLGYSLVLRKRGRLT